MVRSANCGSSSRLAALDSAGQRRGVELQPICRERLGHGKLVDQHVMATMISLASPMPGQSRSTTASPGMKDTTSLRLPSP